MQGVMRVLRVPGAVLPSARPPRGPGEEAAAADRKVDSKTLLVRLKFTGQTPLSRAQTRTVGKGHVRRPSCEIARSNR
jgi:hypothetical protein